MVILAKFMAWFLARLSPSSAAMFGRSLGRLLHALAFKRIEQTRGALQSSFPEWTGEQVKEVTRKVFINQGLFFAEFFRKVGRPKRDPLDDVVCTDDDLARFHGVMQEYKSAIFLVGHINNYEYLSAWAARQFPLTIITKPIKPKSLGDFIMKARAEAGIQEFHHHGTYRSVLRNLNRGGCVGFILDQNIPRERGVFVTFFGRPACTSPGLAMMSAHAGAPVIPGYTLREDGRLRVRFGELIPPPPNREIATLQDYTQRYTTALEQVIRQQPEGWIWMHRRWKTQPRPGDRITRPDGTDYLHAAD